MSGSRSTSKLCTCSQCALHEFLDDQHQIIYGKYISARNFAKHRAEETKKHLEIQAAAADRTNNQPDNQSNSSLIEVPKPYAESEQSDVFLGLDENENSIYLFYIIMFVTWLHLSCNLSRDNCQTAITALFNILKEVIRRPSSNQKLMKMPKDPRTLLSRAEVDANLVNKICCRTCFHLYPDSLETPFLCTYKPFKFSEECNEALYIQKKTHHGMKDFGEFPPPKKTDVVPLSYGIPRCIFVSQPILNWLGWLLSKPNIELEIDTWASKISNETTLMDVQQGENYRNIDWGDSPASLNLVLSLFVDWFNPRGNRISGKVESTGVFALTCLNLPPVLRNQIPNICLYSATPGPSSPDTTTINHLVKPIVDELLALESGTMINTFQHPNGRLVCVRLLCLSGDLPATKKVAGFAAATATRFCSWCHSSCDLLDSLQLATPRTKDETVKSATASKNAESITMQEKILKETGVRWSELNRLPYWDPAKHVVLGIMHNWLEGILQSHWRYRWKFSAIKESKQSKKRRASNQASNRKRPRTLGDQMTLSTATSSNESELDAEDNDIVLEGGNHGGFFSQDDIMNFRQAMINVVLPNGVARLPANLGEERHGKLKASQWYSLFACIIPLVIFELYVDDISDINPQSNRAKFLMNTAYLMQCTHILFARNLTQNHINRFESSYKKYGESVADLFPGVKIQPNHHAALHIPNQMRAFGPLARVGEFAGERLIGFLQKIKTNNRIDEMSGTMMRRGCQLQRLMDKPAYQAMVQVEEPTPGRLRDRKKIRVNKIMYTEIFNYLVKHDPSLIHRDTVPVPNGGKILGGWARPVRSIMCNGFAVATTKPQNCVVVKLDGQVKYGIVKQLYDLEDVSQRGRKMIVLSPITDMFPKKFQVPTSRFRYYLYLYKTVIGRVIYSKALVVQPSDVVSVAAYRFLPSNTFGIDKDGITLVPHDHAALLDISGSP